MLELRTLGEVSLTAGDGRELHSVLAQSKRVALLAYLASPSTPRFVSRDTLTGLLWPDVDEERARSSLRSSLYFLRRSLGPEVLLSPGEQEVGLDPERLTCDAAAFEAALDEGRSEAALDLYGGDYLRGLAPSGAHAFEEWMDRERRRLRLRAREAALGLARACRGRGEAEAAEGWARRALAIDTWDEAALRLLLEVLEEQGRRAEALRTYERFEARVREELDLEPSPETRAVAEALRKGEAGSPEPSPRGAPESADPRAPGVPGNEGAMEPAPEPAVGSAATAAPPGIDGADRQEAEDRPGGRGLRRAATAIGLALALVLAWRVVVSVEDRDARSPAVAAGAQPADGGGSAADSDPARALDGHRVLVAPLDNRTGDSALDGLGRVAADWLTRGLARTGLVRVVPASETDLDARYLAGSGEVPDHSAMGRRLARRAGAGIAVTGAYYRRGDSLVIDARLVDVGSGEVLGTAEVGAAAAADPLAAVEALRPRLLGALGAAVDPRLSSWSAAAGPPPSYDAYLRYASGLDLFFAGRFERAGHVLQGAGDLHSGFAAPVLWAIFAYDNVGETEREDSLLAAVRADTLRLAPWDRAIFDDLDASRRGDVQAAYEAAARVVAVSPGSEWDYELAYEADALGRPSEAVRILEGMNPDLGWTRVWEAYWWLLADDAHRIGEFDKAERAAREGLTRFPDDRRLALELVAALAARGRADSAEAVFARAPLAADPVCPADCGPPLFPDPASERAREWQIFVVALHERGHEAAARREGNRALAWYGALPEEYRTAPGVCHSMSMILESLKRQDEVETVLRRALPRAVGPWARSLRVGLAVNAAARGDTTAALRGLAAADTVSWPDHPAAMRAYSRAFILANLGRLSQAVDEFRRAFALWPQLAGNFPGSPAADPLRGYPPFQALLSAYRK